MLLTLPMSDSTGHLGEHESWAVLYERMLRELRFRDDHAHRYKAVLKRDLIERIAAREAGDICHVCGAPVTWVDHLPPRDPGGAVRCRANVAVLP